MKTGFRKSVLMLLLLLSLVSCGGDQFADTDSGNKTVDLPTCTFTYPSDWVVKESDNTHYIVSNSDNTKSFEVILSDKTLPITDPAFDYRLSASYNTTTRTVEHTSRTSFHGYPAFMFFASVIVETTSKRQTDQNLVFNVGQRSYIVSFSAYMNMPMSDPDLQDIADSFTIKPL